MRWDTEKSDLEVDVATVAVNLVDDVRHLHVRGVVARSPQSELKKINYLNFDGNIISYSVILKNKTKMFNFAPHGSLK